MKIKVMLIIVVLSALQINAQNNFEESREKFNPKKDPFKDVAAALKEAGQTNRRILLDVGGEWCKWCHILDKFIDEHAEIKKYLLDNYVVTKINYSEENKNEKFLGQFPEIEGYPHFFVLEKDGKFLHSQNTGLLEKDKSYDKEKLLSFLEKWSLKKKL